MLPFSVPKQTLLLAFLNTALPPSSTGLSALGITSVVQNYKTAVADVSLAALINSNHASFESQLNSTAVLESISKQFKLSNLTGYSIAIASMAAAPQLSIASQVLIRFPLSPATCRPHTSCDDIATCCDQNCQSSSKPRVVLRLNIGDRTLITFTMSVQVRALGANLAASNGAEAGASSSSGGGGSSTGAVVGGIVGGILAFAVIVAIAGASSVVLEKLSWLLPVLLPRAFAQASSQVAWHPLGSTGMYESLRTPSHGPPQPL